jgi:hypothetical protein
MLYEVLVTPSGGERFTIERDAPLAKGDTFEENSEPYRVLAIPARCRPLRWRRASRAASEFGIRRVRTA